MFFLPHSVKKSDFKKPAAEVQARVCIIHHLSFWKIEIKNWKKPSQEEIPTSPLGTDPELLSNRGPGASGWPRQSAWTTSWSF